MNSSREKTDLLQTEGLPSSNDDIPDVDVSNQEHKEDGILNLKLDKRGLPLVPQPTDHKDDPLVSLTS